MRLLVVLLGLSGMLEAEQGGFLSGTVRDRSGALISGAEVRVESEQSGASQRVRGDSAGRYSSTELAPGTYKVTVRSDSFRTSTRTGVAVVAGKNTRLDFVIQLLPLQQEVTVTPSNSDQDPMVSGITVSRNAPSASLPSNGRDMHALFSLMPGAIVTPASITSGGQFTVGGQRPNENSFRVDGVSGNVGIGIISVPGAYPAGSLPSMTTIGGTQSLASKEEIEKVDLRSADFAAQYGDRPGAQIDIQTRAGSNEFHGSLLGYIRPHSLDSSDWFARGAASDLPTASVNGWGGSVGGPLLPWHTYFFASFEKTDLHDSAVQLIPVPSAAARQEAGQAYQPILDAFPQPTGRSLTATESIGFSPLQKSAGVTNSSVRIDRTIGRHIQLFARYGYVPSVATSIELGTAYSAFGWKSVTGGVNVVTGNYTQEFRYNYSTSKANATHGQSDTPALDFTSATLAHDIGGAITGLPIGAGTGLVSYPTFWSITQLSIGGLGQTIAGQAGQNSQNQNEGNYSIERYTPKQDLRAGGDFTRLSVTNPPETYSLAITSPGIDALLSGVPLGLTNSNVYGPDTNTDHWSTFVQDTIHVTDRLNLLLGLRWEYTPSTDQYVSSYPYIGYWRGIGTLPTMVASYQTVTASNWPKRYNQFAPRLGLAYHLLRPDVVLRAGAGIFYDTQIGSIVSNENPLSTWQYLPTSATPPTSSGPTFTSAPPVIYLPRALEWRTSVEKSLGERSVFSLSYFGSAGRRLLRNEATIDPITSVLQTLAFASNGTSDYEALLAQYRGNLGSHLYALVSYTWSHSIDTGSSDTEPFLIQPDANVDAKGSSSFDVRHVLNASISYHLGKWNLSSTLFARTGFPFDVTTVDRSTGLGFDNSDRANLVPGAPIWISDSSLPGDRELNPAAFQVPTSGQNGTLGRNALTGEGLFQIDVSLRRQIRLFRSLSAETSLSAFNLLNHPAFSNPVSYLGSALFGQSTSTSNLMLGSGSPTTGLTPLYQTGGPRTVELELHFTF